MDLNFGVTSVGTHCIFINPTVRAKSTWPVLCTVYNLCTG